MAAHESLVAHPATVDLAQLEWALCHAFDAAHAAPLDVAELAALPAQDWPDVCLAMYPSVQLLALQWVVGPDWHALKTGQEEVPAPVAVAVLHELLGSGVICSHPMVAPECGDV